MNPRRWQQIQEVLAEALELEPRYRPEFLDRSYAGDAELRAAVEALLAAQAPEELGEPMSTSDTTEEMPSGPRPPHGRIGPYEIREKIGEGGFGEVFLARQISPVRRERVALKMIKPGMDTQRVLARFDAERQALALMNHPNIASVLSAGTTPGGRPYFVMEYVPGLPITKHCDRERLTIEQRLGLFCRVGDAIQHAHQKGVIHRDIKPSNVLVAFENGEAVPKVIDFGVAKALDRPLTDQPLHTLCGELVGTPAYMSPELADPTIQDIDTRSDVYALGVLLYELLTGVLPFDPEDLRRAGYDEMRRIIREKDPPRPSTRISTMTTADGEQSLAVAAQRKLRDPRTLERRMREDLDWIALKCLEKDRTRRYSGAATLVEDVKRHLANEPVDAGPPRLGYRARKFLRRHRGAVASLSLTGVVLLAGIVVSTALFVNWKHERGQRLIQQAEIDRHHARDVLDEARALAYGFPPQARQRAADALELDRDLDEARILRVTVLVTSQPREIEQAIAEGREAFERSDRSPALAALLSALLEESEPREARRFDALAGKVLTEDRLYYYRALGTTDDEDTIALLETSLAHNPWQLDVTEQLIQRLLTSGQEERAFEEARLLTLVARELPVAWNLEGVALGALGRYDEALDSFDRTIDVAPSLWLGYAGRAWVALRQGRYEAALDDLATALELSPGNRDVLAMIGAAKIKQKDFAGAVEALDAAIEAWPDFQTLRDRGFAQQQLGQYEDALRDLDAAAQFSTEAPEPLAALHDRRGSVLRMLDRFDEARDAFETALELDPALARARQNVGYLEFVAGNDEVALEHLNAAIALTPGRWESNRGVVYWFLHEFDDAMEDLRPYAARPGCETVYAWLWEIESEAGRPAEAERALTDALAATDRDFVGVLVDFLRGEKTVEELVQVAESRGDELVAYLTAAGKARLDGQIDEAEDWLRRAVAVDLRTWQEHDIAARRLAELSGNASPAPSTP